MASELELDKALSELKRITGITLEVKAKTPEELELALTQVHCLCLAYKEKYNKNHFLQTLMTDGIPSYDIFERASRLHIDAEVPRVLFLVETKGPIDDTIMEVLKNLFPSQSKTYLVSMGERNLVILRPLKTSETPADIGRLAHMIVDTLNMEALTRVQTAYSGTVETLMDLSAAYRETSLALKVGKLFYSEQTIFPYNQLGIGRLIYQLPVTICENFLKEIFGGEVPRTFDEETTATINKFFQNNLNIAETSRQLHMHRNTLIYRLEQIERRTGLDIRRFEDAMTFKIATMVINYLQTERNS
ncbi:MAG: helix-turn-helix domain-containing protein [Faecalicatena sp.]|uniref:PucR family transcriptional regulator n=1 Tax=Faecalicatena sp. TaxID=2005360 RepID=UPI002589E5A6|nr:helix-turn-helix domain-containing protein [Faecalicatena sp.]MCI6467124.1 helix-turn-helix domain-containing protein [Faecalicatena sp.]MDY5618908.1 helix-turn-helix domain-containing protein [Lachnospiraceae bacterium]